MSPAPPEPEEVELELLIEAIRLRWQHDFRGYARAPLRRRVAQLVDRLGLGSISALQARVLRDPAAFAQALDAMTVKASALFRDPDWFAAVRREVLPRLATHPSIKVWVAGCSRGEELWSLLVLFDEARLLERALFYATDIAPEALRDAGRGVFPLGELADASRRYLASGGTASLSDWYVAAYDHVAFDRRLRERVVFAEHSLATDAVFSEVHFVSCRNVLIWFDAPLRERVLGLFAEALVHGGVLGLGPTESLHGSAHASAFAPIAGTERLWRRTATPPPSAHAATVVPGAGAGGGPR